jgi:hypothetical protein
MKRLITILGFGFGADVSAAIAVLYAAAILFVMFRTASALQLYSISGHSHLP